MDHASPRLEGRAQPLRHHLRKSLAGELNVAMITMNQQRRMPGCGNRGKTNCRFPTVPTAPTTTAADISEQKAAEQEQPMIVYTQCLTLPFLYTEHCLEDVALR